MQELCHFFNKKATFICIFYFFVLPLQRIMAKIGIFDSGYGGLTILDAIRKELPGYDYIYLGDNARTAPALSMSFTAIPSKPSNTSSPKIARWSS